MKSPKNKPRRFVVAQALAVLFAALLAGCATTSGTAARTTTSSFDGSRTVVINPHGTNCGMSMVCSLLGAVWNSNVPEKAQFVVEYDGDYSPIDAAALNIDGKVIELEPVEATTAYSNDMAEAGVNQSAAMNQLTRESKRRFWTSLDTIRRIESSRNVKMRVVTPRITIDSVIIDGTKDSKAFYALQRLLAQIGSTSN